MWLGERNKTLIFKSEDKQQTYFDATEEECASQVKDTLGKDSLFAILPLQDWLSMSSRIRSRFPYSETLQSKTVWKYRMHLNIESLLEADSLNNLISNLLKEGGRNQ